MTNDPPTLNHTHNRPADEPLDKCLARIARNAAPAGKPKKKKKEGGSGGGAPGDAAAAATARSAPPALFASASAAAPIPADTPNAAAWTGAAVLEVGGVVYEVVVNPPTVVKVRKREKKERERKGERKNSRRP
jgi:hypothetical protein